jgi:hypothetical protein
MHWAAKRLLDLVAALLALCGAVFIALWARSLAVDDCFYRASGPSTSQNVTSIGGQLHFGVTQWRIGTSPFRDWRHHREGQSWRHPFQWPTLGFRFVREQGTQPGNIRGKTDLVVPYWFLTALTLTPAALRLRAAIRRTRRTCPRQRTLCPNCGYDCRATPDRCPECGTFAGSKANP